ncbi:MAG TPA: PQQ-dependent sugar dehydrogenase [Spirochaetota bacterium]|nr:PQQ-dependent sugar dehydrogenase [Spirochaetota bacterium]
MLLKRLLIIFVLINSPFSISAADPKPQLMYKSNSVIWGFTFINANEIIISEKSGKLGLFMVNSRQYREINHNIPFSVHGQGGLLDVAYDSSIMTLFITYARKTKTDLYTTALASGKYSENTNSINFKEIFVSKAESPKGVHFGSRIALDKKSRQLYITIGDRGLRKRAQDLAFHNGKILRLTYNGDAVSTNPFYNKKNALPEIFSYGHRNPQGIYIRKDGHIFISEFGPKGGDEINIILPGKNYGWPLATYGKEYSGATIAPTHHPGTEQPVVWYVPAISPSGMTIYEHDYFPQWTGQIFMGALSARHLHRLNIIQGENNQKVKMYSELNKRVRHVSYNDVGQIFFSTDHGELYIISK